MKTLNSSLLVLFIALMCKTGAIKAGAALLTWANPSAPTTWYNTGFGVCGEPPAKNFKVQYEYCPGIIIVGGDCGPGGCGANPYRFTVTLYRNGVPLSTQTFQTASAWSNTLFYNVPAYAGNYTATVQLERRQWSCFTWQTIDNVSTGTITASTTPATPNFNVNGIGVPADGSPIDVCISNIRINADATTCETAYFLGVQESDRWWNRTYDYEWGLWFSGQAPNNINLQQMASTYSVPPYYTGSPARQGSILIGGSLPGGADRYYRVNVCTGTPAWNCKTALIKVNNGCKTQGRTDVNTYTLLEESQGNEVNLDERITTAIEALIKSEISSFRVFPNPAGSNFQVEIPAGKAIQRINIYNSLGGLVESIALPGTQEVLLTNIDASGFHNGLYFIEFIGESGKWNSKVLVSK